MRYFLKLIELEIKIREFSSDILVEMMRSPRYVEETRKKTGVF